MGQPRLTLRLSFLPGKTMIDQESNWKGISEWEQLMSEYGLSPEESFEESEQDGE
jgi:hypothetical protein